MVYIKLGFGAQGLRRGGGGVVGTLERFQSGSGFFMGVRRVGQSGFREAFQNLYKAL